MERGPERAAPRSSLRLNMVANYAGQLYAGLAGVLMVPVYLHWFGAEVYGLIGFYTLLQAWAQLLDLGLSASMSRQASLFAGGRVGAAGFRRLLRAFEWMFWGLGAALALGLAAGAGPLASSWLRVAALPTDAVRLAIQLMALAVGLRWIATLYRSVLVGVERQLWLNGFTAAIVTLRFVVVVPLVVLSGSSVLAFFVFQVLVALLEVAGLLAATYRAAPVTGPVRLAGAWPALRDTLRFSAWAAVAAVIWVSVTQVDKLVLSATLALPEYGFFTAAVNAASPVTLLSLAVAQALLPRLTQLAGGSDAGPMLEVYRRTTQLVVAVGAALALTLAALAEPILWAWTGDAAFAARYRTTLALYAIGNLFMLLETFAYCLQYARGDLRLHVLGNVLFAAVTIPLLAYAASRFGAPGAAWVWAAFNGAFFLAWTPLIHRRFAPGMHASWMWRDVLRVAAAPVLIAAVAANLHGSHALGRLGTTLFVAATLLVLLLAGWMATDEGRRHLLRIRAPRQA